MSYERKSQTHPFPDKAAGDYGSNGEMGGAHKASADDMLNALGYQSELTRSRSTLQVAFMSFVLASVPYGLATTLYYPLIGGGPVAVIWGWVMVCLIILCVAISLGEITSVYPTAGGVYYQTYMLSPPWCRNIMAWICGWAYTLGNITITLSVNFGTTLLFIGCINVFTRDGAPIWNATTWQTWLLFVAITLLCNAISALGNKWLPMLDTGAIFFTFAGVLAIIITILAVAKNGRRDASYAFGHFESSSGWVPGWSFFIGLLHAAYATSATGMILSMCEEVRQPATQVPKAMVGTIILNMICGFIFLVPLMFVLPPIEDLLVLAQPFPYIMSYAVGNEGGAFALCVPIMALAICCGTACTTASSRCTWAFARDGAIPGSRWWKEVNKKLDIPLNAMMLCMVVELALGLIYFGSTAAFNGFSGAGVIFLTIAYAMPIFVSLITGRKSLKNGEYDFGIFGVFCNVVAIADTMNYASAVFAGGTIVSALWYFAWGRHNYQGPPAKQEEVERRRSSMIVTE
ncbi:hypothetical protein LTR24_003300 [Lithohypha guttulata]|uniref:Amino acid transporter n=1 Tax=Lithohypha guttulata TaxID=1690604 RepID=A0ABR0KFH9_9EURO|nr:hypothetical protein LTR24_003300 [Lithohypha guttulata]